ncbi:App1 family protein, partial [Massilia sp. ST3]|uniref:App1 family protein n=1 Tax=Massilia sp. ST3 TaxID=2824903 RepID=UPI001B82A8D8
PAARAGGPARGVGGVWPAAGAGGAAWIEHAVAAPGPVAPAAEPERLPEEQSRALHRRLAGTVGSLAGHALRRLGRFGQGGNPMLLPYLGFGNAGKLWVKGRVLDEVDFREQTGQDSGWHNLVALYRRLESDQVAGARVVARFQDQVLETHTDRGGYFAFEIQASSPVSGGWHEVELELPDSATRARGAVRTVAQVSVPAASARFGIISDIDDTVLWTNVTNKLNMALMLARSNAHTRKPFKGVAAFYRALSAGASGQDENPMFYVSSSPWHLFGPLVDFLRVQGIPLGPLLLRELNMSQMLKLTSHGSHKLDKIEQILGYYPDMQFVLIGDSGEQDPEIYTEVVRRHPKAVRMIYIRNVNPDPARIDALDRLIAEVSATGAQLILAPDSVFAASHAAAEGLIHVDRLADVRSDKREDDKLVSRG